MTAPSSVKQRELRVRKKLMAAGVICAAVYGLLARAQFFLRSAGEGRETQGMFEVMTVGFIFGVPLSVGFLAVYVGQVRSFWRALVFPQIPALVALGAALALAWEGWICIWLWLPLFSVVAAAGGILGALALRLPSPIGRKASLGVALVLPYGGMLAEHRLHGAPEVRLVETSIDISAPAHVVWEQIVEVPRIREEEHGFALSHWIGFPRPVAAVSNGRGVGSVREASFERGVVFVEEVTQFEENKLLSFSIHANPESIPARALDEHVTVGGPYFDVLQGTYRIESRSGGVRLHLSSEHRLSTSFNVYSGLWTDFIMRDTQQYILEIVARRAERALDRL